MRRLCAALLLAWCILGAVPTYAAGSRHFPETGFTIEGRFLEYWKSNGGLAQFGYPISPVLSEPSEDGKARQVQYFERNRFELHPEKARPHDVLLGRLGALSLSRRGIDWQTLPKGSQSGGCQFFGETGHSLCGAFNSYWQSHGGLAIFGLPISEPREEVSPTDGRTYLVQHFERNRFELHPENQDPYRVQLGLLGSEIFGRQAKAAPAPAGDQKAQRLLDLVNQARRNAGLGPVALSGALNTAAANYSQVQAAQGRISHVGPDGSSIGDRINRVGYRWSACAENLAAGYAGPDEVFAAWMQSAGHRANILNPKMREMGVGHTHRDGDPARLNNYWVLVLAAPR
jgi:uncharacterized protein YkwD